MASTTVHPPPDEVSEELCADREALLAALIARSVIRSEDEPTITSMQGRPNRWIVDTRVLLLDPIEMRRIARLFLDATRTMGEFQVACLETTGIPLMLGIQHTALTEGRVINGLIIRKEPKKNGRMRAIEGTPNDLPVIFVDDLLNSASSFEQGMAVLEFRGLEVPLFWALVDFHREHGAERVLEAGCSFITEYSIDELGLDLAPKREPRTPFPWARAWQFRPPAEIKSFHVVPKSVPVYRDGIIYYGAEDGAFYAVDAETGEQRWLRQTGERRKKGIYSSAILIEDTVIFGSYDGNVYCLDHRTGKDRWIFREADWVGSSPAYVPETQQIIIGLEHSLPGKRGSIIAIDWRTGGRVWECPVPGLVHGTPLYVAEHDVLVIGTNDKEILFLDATNGLIRAILPVGGEVKSIPAYDRLHDAVLVGAYDKKLYSVSLKDFQVRWTIETNDILYSQPLIEGNICFLTASDRHVYKVDTTTGAVLGSVELQGRVFSSPRRTGSLLYAGTTAGKLYALHPETMEVNSYFQLHQRITTAIGSNEDGSRLFVLTNDSVLTSLQR